MANTFERALSISMDRFEKLIMPDLVKYMGGRFMIVEGQDNEIAKTLDMDAGIDILHIGDKGIKGIGSRIQSANKCWSTFTFRKARESGADTGLSTLNWTKIIRSVV